jgi:hypothetical protein
MHALKVRNKIKFVEMNGKGDKEENKEPGIKNQKSKFKIKNFRRSPVDKIKIREQCIQKEKI